MSMMPEPVRWALEPVRTKRDLARQRRSDSSLYAYALNAYERSQKDQIDSQTTRDALECAFDEECSLFDHGMAKAGASVTKQQLLADKLEMLAKINNRRIGRRFS
jgi:hypothetical protein